MALTIPFTLPPGSNRGPVVFVVILERENLERMREGDPFDVQLRAYAPFMSVGRPLRDLDIVIAYEEDREALIGFKKRDDIAGLLQWLERGRKRKPGDAGPPVPVR